MLLEIILPLIGATDLDDWPVCLSRYSIPLDVDTSIVQ